MTASPCWGRGGEVRRRWLGRGASLGFLGSLVKRYSGTGILPVIAHGLQGRATGGTGILPVIRHGLEGHATTG